MKKVTMFVLCILAAASLGHAQEMQVIPQSGQTQAFNLADIANITFEANALRLNGDILRVHTADGMTPFALAGVDSLAFADGRYMTIYQSSGDADTFALADVDSLTFADSPAGMVTVVYDGTTATVTNPYEGAGVVVQVTGADVVVTAAGVEGVTYALSGTAADGKFKVYSDDDFTIRLAGLNLTNLDGPAINVQADVTIGVELVDGTTNDLTDGVTYTATPGEDQKAAFFSEGQLLFSGAGSLVIHGRGTAQHGLGSDDFVQIDGGTIVVATAVKDAVHTNQGFYMNGGSLEVTSQGDGVDGGAGPVEIHGGAVTVHSTIADVGALKCSGTVLIAGGTTNLTVAGNQSKGIKGADVQLTGGDLVIHTTGGVVLVASGSGYDPSYCSAIKADNLVLLDGCHVTVTATGSAGRGISSNDITILSGSLNETLSGNGGTYVNATGVTDAYHGPCLNADGDVVISGGTLTLTHSGSGGKGINGDSDLRVGTASGGPTLQITTTGASISIGGGEYAEAKAVSVDSTLIVSGGTLTLSTPDDALKAKVRLQIDGGLVNVTHCMEGYESPTMFLNGGETHIVSTDDGINTTYGVDGEANDGSNLTINGGYVHVNAVTGDGIDGNGNITIAGGTIVVHGPASQPEVGIDVNGTFRINGGLTIVSQPNHNMVEVPHSTSTQRSVLLRRTSSLTAGTLFHIEDAAGNSLVTFAPARSYACILLSTNNLIAGTTYRVLTGGTCTGTVRDGLYSGGTYSGGTLRATFTSSGMVQQVTF